MLGDKDDYKVVYGIKRGDLWAQLRYYVDEKRWLLITNEGFEQVGSEFDKIKIDYFKVEAEVKEKIKEIKDKVKKISNEPNIDPTVTKIFT